MSALVHVQSLAADKPAAPLLREEGHSAGALGEAYATFCRPRMMEMLSAIGLDVHYHRAEGDQLFLRDQDGEEVAVLDLLGGFGASLFGHNHPRLLARAIELLKAKIPFNAQASVRGAAGLLARRLSDWVGGATGRHYVTTLASTGAEVVEAALKHAEMERRARMDRQLSQLRDEGVRLSAALASGEVSWSDQAREQAAALTGLGVAGDSRRILDELLALASRVLERPSLVLALTGAFHGKTTGALRLTHNPEYRAPWRQLGHATFLPPNDVQALDRAIAGARASYPVPRLVGGLLQLEIREDVNVSGFFLEPIQGEGGIWPIRPDYAAHLRQLADQAGFPVIVDEIQSGMGRTGSFLASEGLGLRGDYYLLSKSLGGGLAKIAALMVERPRYQHEFGYLHTSTFADDELSACLALSALDLLEENDRALLTTCRDKGEVLLARLRALQHAYPQVIEDVRGRGLMIGLQLRAGLATSPLVRVLAEQKLLGFFAAGYLLHQWRIRVAPALSSHGTLRLEPSAYLSAAAIDHFCTAIEALARALRDGDTFTLVQFLTPEALPVAPLPPPAAPPRWPLPPAARASQRAAFLVHFAVPSDLRHFDAAFAALDGASCARFLDRIRDTMTPFLLDSFRIGSATGAKADLAVIGLPFHSQQIAASMREGNTAWALQHVRDGVQLARHLDCGVIGFGGYSSIVSDNCRSIAEEGVVLTSGNSLTVAAALAALFKAARRAGMQRRRLGVLGATGNIGAMLAELGAEQVDELVLVGRPGAARRLQALASGLSGQVTVATDLAALRGCNLIVAASNAPAPILRAQHLGDGPVIVCDVAVPTDVHADVAERRPDCLVLKGGVVRLPGGQTLHNAGLSVAPGCIYACMAETLLLALSGSTRHHSFGALRAEDVRQTQRLAEVHGFTIDEWPWRGPHGP